MFHALSFTCVTFKDVFTDYANGLKKVSKRNPLINPAQTCVVCDELIICIRLKWKDRLWSFRSFQCDISIIYRQAAVIIIITMIV